MRPPKADAERQTEEDADSAADVTVDRVLKRLGRLDGENWAERQERPPGTLVRATRYLTRAML